MSNNLSYVLEPGQKVFKINIETGAIEQGRFTVIKNPKTKKNNALVKEIKGCIHLPAYNKNHASVLYKNIVAKAMRICSACGAENKDLVTCVRCEHRHCNDCQAPYNQHTQIDFDCCKTCASAYEE